MHFELDIYSTYGREPWGAFPCPFCEGKSKDPHSFYVFPYIKRKVSVDDEGVRRVNHSYMKTIRAYARCFQCNALTVGTDSVPALITVMKEKYIPGTMDLHKLRRQFFRRFFHRLPPLEKGFFPSEYKGSINPARCSCPLCEKDGIGHSGHLFLKKNKVLEGRSFSLSFRCARCHLRIAQCTPSMIEWAVTNNDRLEWVEMGKYDFFEEIGVPISVIESYNMMKKG